MGLLVGLALGGLGGGGAILTIPALIYLLGEPPATAAAGSLVIVLATCVIGLVPHLRDARVRLTDGFIFGALGILGSVLGSRWSSGVREEVLLSAFAILLIVVAAVMALRARRQGHEAPDRIVAQRDTAWLLRLVIAASGVGLLTGFFGVGGRVCCRARSRARGGAPDARGGCHIAVGHCNQLRHRLARSALWGSAD
ncbi:MAG: sulfite exporter TauE/SafE family protein [Marmoricola sp.]